MVCLTMTAAIVAGLERLKELRGSTSHASGTSNETADATGSEEQPTATAAGETPDLENPAVGKPIAHGQILDLWRELKTAGEASWCLEQLLRGSQVHVPPPPPKPEPTPEYKALMARLRREEEERAYERMMHPPPRHETFDERFPHASAASFAAVNRPTHAADMGDDDVTYNDIQRQVLLLFNFLVSIAGVAGTLWMAARWWSLAARLLLTMGGAMAVAIAEVGVYSVYVWRMGESKKRQDAAKEVKEVVQSWVVGEDKVTDGPSGEEGAAEVLLPETSRDGDDAVRKRKPVSRSDE